MVSGCPSIPATQVGEDFLLNSPSKSGQSPVGFFSHFTVFEMQGVVTYVAFTILDFQADIREYIYMYLYVYIYIDIFSFTYIQNR